MTTTENIVVALANATEARSYATHLEDMALSHPAFRAAGSVSAKATAEWIVRQFQGSGYVSARSSKTSKFAPLSKTFGFG